CDNDAKKNGCEVKLDSDAANCGACGKQCMGAAPNAMSACVASVCSLACNKGWGDCDNDMGNGCEKDVTSDAANCGACAKACANGQSCVASRCSGCASGRYEGPAAATALGIMVTGTISFKLGAPMGDQYPVILGSLSLTGPNMASASATVTGTLDC